MKKAFLCVMLLCSLNAAWCTTQKELTLTERYSKEGKVFSVINTKTELKAYKTEYFWIDTNGVRYPIWMSVNNKAYIIRTSRTGNEYKKYLPDTVAKQIMKEQKQKQSHEK